MTTALEQLLTRHVDAGTVPGAVALVDRRGVEVAVAGLTAVGGEPLRDDAIMQIRSMTKAVTAVAALRLVETDRLELDAGLDDWLPELAGRPVLTRPGADLDDTVPAVRALTLRDLLTNASGYGMALTPSPLQRAMADDGLEAGPDPSPLSAQEWLGRLAALPLAFQPGAGWRYHHSFGLLGILLSRVAGRPLGEHLAADLFGPLGMVDTGFWVAEEHLDRLPAAHQHDVSGLVETAPAGGGFFAGPPPFDVSHGELVSTVADYHRFVHALVSGAAVDGRPLVTAEHRQQMLTDQVPASSKTPDSFFPGFWDTTGWGFGVGVDTDGPDRGRISWSGGQGTTFFADPDQTIGVLLTQVELGPAMGPLLEEFLALT